MTDYPTRAEIDATSATLRLLRSHLGGELVHTLAWTAINNTLRILDNLAAVPGLHYPDAEPEPETKPTALQALREAWLRADPSVEEDILSAALKYAQSHPEWFDGADWSKPQEALSGASVRAYHAECIPAQYALIAASHVANDHPHLFGGAA